MENVKNTTKNEQHHEKKKIKIKLWAGFETRFLIAYILKSLILLIFSFF